MIWLAEAEAMAWITSIYWLLDIPASFLVGYAILEAKCCANMPGKRN